MVAATSRMRRRVASSGRRPSPAATFSAMCPGLVVSVSTTVTAGFARMYLMENCAHVSQSKSAAQGGSGRPAVRLKYDPFMNGSYFRRTAGRPLPPWAADFDCETWAQFSIKYILANPAVTVVLTETTNPGHMAENVAAGLGRLPDEATRRRMREVAATI